MHYFWGSKVSIFLNFVVSHQDRIVPVTEKYVKKEGIYRNVRVSDEFLRQ